MSTAALPLSHEKELWERMGFVKEEEKLFQALASGGNVRYVVIGVPYQGLADDEELIVQRVQRQL